MLSRYLLCALYLVHGAVPLALPDVAQVQVPLLSSQQRSHAKSEHMSVLIAYKRGGEDHEAILRFPLRQPLRGMSVARILELSF